MKTNNERLKTKNVVPNVKFTMQRYAFKWGSGVVCPSLLVVRATRGGRVSSRALIG
jgi:hypothetical protein